MPKPARVMIISFDAVGREDLPFLQSLPNFGAFFRKGALCPHVQSVYPSLTYPAHTSILTGRMPKNHGVVHNTKLQPGREKPDWICQRKYIRSTTLYDEARKNGWRVAALLWPVVGRSRIPYAVPEMMVTRKWQSQILVNALNGPIRYQLDLNRRFGHLRDGVRQPALDDFIHASALYTIRRYNPDLFFLHLTDVDTNRHIYGVHHEKALHALRRQDRRLGELLDALARTGDMEKTAVVLLGDHYQKDVQKIAFVNYFLRQEGFFELSGGRLKSWKAVAKSCDGSAYIYLNKRYRNDNKMKESLQNLLQKLERQADFGIRQIFDSRQAAGLGADPACFAMLEAKPGWCFLDEWETPVKKVQEEKRHATRGTHGYLPQGEAYETFFAAGGCGIRPGVLERRVALWDEGVTLAALMGLDLGQADGSVIREILA